MLPSLSPLSSVAIPDGGPGRGSVSVPPPRGFRAPQEPIRQVNVSWMDYARASGNTIAKQNGLRFEAKVQKHLASIFSGYMPNPQVSFRDKTDFRIVRPDGLLPLRNRLVIFEVKSQHMPEAWWQLRRLYEPVLRHWVDVPIQVVEIVKSFDPAMPFPEPIELVGMLELWVSEPKSWEKFGVWKWPR